MSSLHPLWELTLSFLSDLMQPTGHPSPVSEAPSMPSPLVNLWRPPCMATLFLLSLPGLVRTLPNANRKIHELANPKGNFIIRLQAVSARQGLRAPWLQTHTGMADDQSLCPTSLLLLTGHLVWFFSPFLYLWNVVFSRMHVAKKKAKQRLILLILLTS